MWGRGRASYFCSPIVPDTAWEVVPEASGKDGLDSERTVDAEAGVELLDANAGWFVVVSVAVGRRSYTSLNLAVLLLRFLTSTRSSQVKDGD